MKTKVYCQTATAPSAFVTKSRQRVKQYGTVIYLKDGDEFEIELYNPTNSKVLAKIKLNGKYITDTGIVLRPGERVYLERYLDEARKFKFETYNVDGSDPNVVKAIEINGDLEVEFYEEYYPTNWTYSYDWSYNQHVTSPYPNRITYTGGDSHAYYFNSSSDVNIGSNSLKSKNTVNSLSFSNSLETGRVEKGDHSNQDFGVDYSSYNSYFTWKVEWKILPESQKSLVKEDLKVFCTSCGTKRRKTSHKFCPNCGNKF